MVITGRTRNAFALRGTRVRIPPSPFQSHVPAYLVSMRAGAWDIFYAKNLDLCVQSGFVGEPGIEYIIRKHRSGDVEDVFCAGVWVASAPGLHSNKN